MKKIYGSACADPTSLELHNRALARAAASEGFVLLKNEGGALPLQSKKIALYGMGARLTVKGGLGSGSVEERYSVNIEDGLKNAGYEITTGRWLDDYDQEYRETYREYRGMVEERIKGLTDPMEIIPLAHSFVYRFPSGRAITAEDAAQSGTDTAVYVLMRQAGEGNDRKLEKGDYYITDIERENLKTVAASYAHTILVINVGGHIDMAFLDEIEGIDAVVLFIQGGEEGGNALADVLSGKVNFSGKLADTIPMRYEDIPFGNEFSYLNGDLENEYYKEGIYVGYRYFDSFRKPVRYPFGFGLSYTGFQTETELAELTGTAVRLRVKVSNTGKRSGKEVVRRCRNCCGAADELPAFAPEAPAEWEAPADVPILLADLADLTTETVDYTEPAVTETAQEKEILDRLTLEEQAWFLQGGALQNPPPGTFDIHGAAGKTVTALLDKGIRNVVFSDGPAGVNIVNRVHALPTGGFAPADIPERYNWGALGAGMKARLANIPGPIVHRYATAWPVEMLLAQTWNTPLLREIGAAVGEEMCAFGITVWLAPGMNIHRSPLGGRTFEYYSEDPVLTGEMAAALTAGVQSHPGAGVSIKHFCCNNTEDNRNGISSNVSERALREIYLKGFEIAVRKSQPKTVMSSYNLLNHVYTANRRDLLTDILRCEWGFEGLVMTDWGGCGETAAVPEQCAPAGNDLIMPGGDFDRKGVLEAIADGRLDAATVRRCACRVLRMMLGANVPVLLEDQEIEECEK